MNTLTPLWNTGQNQNDKIPICHSPSLSQNMSNSSFGFHIENEHNSDSTKIPNLTTNIFDELNLNDDNCFTGIILN